MTRVHQWRTIQLAGGEAEQCVMEILETSVFTRQVQQSLTDEEYRVLQLGLVKRPDEGAVIRGSGGLRKLRWSIGGRGKRGGLRIIYYWAVARDQLLMLFLYPKGKKEDLTPEQLKRLKAFVEVEYP